MAYAPKDALVLCLDVGPGMQQAPPGSDSPLDASLKIITMMVQRKIFAESKDEIAIILFGSEDTCNDLADDEGYQNITVLHQLTRPSFDLLETIEKIGPGSEETDFLDALVVGLDILHKQTQGKKIESRKLILFSNFDHQFSEDNLNSIIDTLKDGIELNIVCPQFEHPDHMEDDYNDSGSDGEGPSVKRRRSDNRQTLVAKPKTPQQRAGERLITHMINEGVDGCVFSYEQAVLAVTGFEKKSVRSAAWKCDLTLGTELTIPCTAYVKTKASTLKKSWTKCYAKTGKAEDLVQQKYFVLQSDHNKEVEEDSLGKGYKYGRDIVPFSKIDEEQMKYKTEGKCLAILGFTSLKNICIQDIMDDQAHFLMPEKDDEAAQSALNALILALRNQNMCAVARYVYRKGTNPKLVALIPRIKGAAKCFVMVALPFAEDVRALDFPGFESQQSGIPDENQLAAIDKLITSMGLCNGDEHLYKPKELLNPYYQWVYHNLSHRAHHPNSPIPPLDKRITDLLGPNQEVTERSRSAAEEVKACFSLVKQEKKGSKMSGKDMWEDIDLNKTEKEDVSNASGDASSGVNISDLFQQSNVTSVGSVTPDEDFINLLKTKSENMRLIFEQMQQRILEFVLDSFGLHADKVLPCLRILREQAVEKDQVDVFNLFLKEFKNMLLNEGVNYRLKFWDEMVSSGLSLIVSSDVSEEDSKDFLVEEKPKNDQALSSADDKVDEMDLLDEL